MPQVKMQCGLFEPQSTITQGSSNAAELTVSLRARSAKENGANFQLQ
ncbi:hypothetical protein L798_01077 [Zootermopsis nevadensis]|uniref:Uncharacterized protein n=1 Tax=Zootermopsis nevadensis TaxID=136037 RepID=A0A067REQ3_ZOONE|nr:hypothetical protein L798_01077 [Zootermopsis nevadensis]